MNGATFEVQRYEVAGNSVLPQEVITGWLGPDSGWQLLLPGFVLGGIGIGLTNPALASTAVGVVSPERSGMASSLLSAPKRLMDC